MEYAVRIARLWPATMNLIHWMKGVLAPMEEKAAVSAGCWTVPNADVASRKATCSCSSCSIAYSYISLTTSMGASHEPPCTNPN